ncbi:hypothetical protein [Romboutsia sp.]|uniref:lysine 5,6-aminomutase reactivase subunit KamB n=1 Tax=Romboutsia sp. TaxID=1965302 RepID=UPI003F3F0617
MINIIEEIKKYKSLSIVGNYKNVGKTTTLNYILDKAKGNITLGLTSIGVDGEKEDTVTKTPKPRIYISKGSIIATAKSCVLKSDITKEILEATDIHTPLGKIIIFKALSDGYVELAGPSRNSGIKYVCDRLNYLGCEIAIVDGALSRKTLASPSITEATIFCSGAVLANNIDKVVEQTIFEVEMMNIENINDDKLMEIYEEINECKVCIIDEAYNYKNLNLKTTLNSHEDIVENLEENTKYIFINGIVTNSFIESLIKSNDKYKNKTILVKDGTKIFLDKLVYSKFIVLGGNIKSIDKINLIGVSLNPTSINGYSFDSEIFEKSVSENISIPVFDVYRE